METYERSELGGIGEGVLGVWHGWRIATTAPSQDLLGNKFPSQAFTSREGREGGFAFLSPSQRLYGGGLQSDCSDSSFISAIE